MKHLHSRLATLVLAGLVSVAAHSAFAEEPISLKAMGSFHVGGKLIELSGLPEREAAFTPGATPVKVNPNGSFMAGQMYVQYFIPQEEKGVAPLLMWHGGGLTGVTYETTPDGREGWLNYFLRKGWAVYNSDSVERGRSGFAQPEIFPGEPVFLAMAHRFESFRIGDGAGSYSADPAKQKVLPGNQFPVEAYENLVKQGVPRWTTTNDFAFDAYAAEIEKVCPCVLMVHSQAGLFGFTLAAKYPDKILGLVAVEPSTVGDPAIPDLEKAAALKDVPLLIIYGDYAPEGSRWGGFRDNAQKFAGMVRDAGGTADLVSLPERGIKGNGHMMMMDKNNAEIAGIIDAWMVEKKLYK